MFQFSSSIQLVPLCSYTRRTSLYAFGPSTSHTGFLSRENARKDSVRYFISWILQLLISFCSQTFSCDCVFFSESAHLKPSNTLPQLLTSELCDVKISENASAQSERFLNIRTGQAADQHTLPHILLKYCTGTLLEKNWGRESRTAINDWLYAFMRTFVQRLKNYRPKIGGAATIFVPSLGYIPDWAPEN